MNKAVLLGVGAVVAATAMSGSFGAGTAAAKGPNLSGQTYAQASEKIASWGSKAVISSVVGDQRAIDDCIVTGTNKAGFLNSSGRQQESAYLLDLNCNAPIASAGKPGASAASPQGRTAKKELKNLAWFNKDPSKNCGSQLAYCKRLCDKYADSCSTGVQDVLASS